MIDTDELASQSEEPAKDTASHTGAPSFRKGLAGGVIAGIVAISCCAGPAVAGLLGIVSASTAVDLAYDLYGQWAWAFRAAGVAVVVAIVAVAHRRARTCGTDGRLSKRFVATLLLTGVITYGVLYAATTALGRLADESSTNAGTLRR